MLDYGKQILDPFVLQGQQAWSLSRLYQAKHTGDSYSAECDGWQITVFKHSSVSADTHIRQMHAVCHKTRDQLLLSAQVITTTCYVTEGIRTVTKQSHLELGEVGGVCV